MKLDYQFTDKNCILNQQWSNDISGHWQGDWPVACRGGANGVPASGIHGRGHPKSEM